MIPLASFAPDLDPATAGVITDCENLVPTTKGFKGAPSPVGIGYPALAEAVRSLVVVKKLDATTRAFAATRHAIFEGSAGVWTDRSKVGGYDIGNGRWSFAQFGNTSLAAAKAHLLQASTGAAFADVAGSPKASLCAVANSFVMLADTNEGTYGDCTNRWWCSAIYDHADWTPNVATQCTTGLLVDSPGGITALAGLGSNFVAFKESSIYFGQYVGAPAVWQWPMIPGAVGCRAKDGVTSVGNALVFLGNDNFYLFDGSRPQPIGDGIREWFFANSNPKYLANVVAAYDKPNQRVWFFYPSRKSQAGDLDAAVVFHLATGKWGKVVQSIEAATEYVTDPITYATIGNLYATYNDLPTDISLDSPFWMAQSDVLAIADTAHTVQSLTGICQSASLQTGNFGDDEVLSTVTRVRPRFTKAPTSATLTHQYAMESGVDFTAGATVAIVSGRFDLLRCALWHRFRFDLVGDFEITGQQPYFVEDGTA